MDCKLTIIMSNYNQGELLKRALKSVFEQRVNYPFKVIITDDGSTKDNSIEIIQSFVNQYSNVEAIFSKKNTGYLANVLRAKRNTKTDYFCLLDADDYWIDNNYLQEAYDFLEDHPDYSIYESNVFVLPVGSSENDLNKSKTFVPRRAKTGTYTKEMFTSNAFVPITQTTGMFFRNTIFKYGIPEIMEEAVGTLSERSFEGDVDRFVMHLKTGKAYFVNKPVGVYRLTPGGIWARLPDSEKVLLNARSYMDYCTFYQSDTSFFAEKACSQIKLFFENKLKELSSVDKVDDLISEKSFQNLNEVYRFCCENIEAIRQDTKKPPMRKRIKKAIRILLSR